MPRLFDFVGSDQEYIEYLESKFQALESSPDLHSAPSQQQANDFRFVECRPQAAEARQLAEKRSATEWEKQLQAFISSIPGRHEWQKARKDAGVDTVQRNRQAMCLMLGQQTAAIFVSAEGSIMLPRMHPCDNQNLVLKGCMYGEFICRCDNDKSFAVRVAAYQKLIFLSYCTVLLRIGMSRDTVYSMMGMYSDSKKTSTLDYYCSGALWVNRCMSTLLKNGWGYKSWEIFLLGKAVILQTCQKQADTIRTTLGGYVWAYRSQQQEKLFHCGRPTRYSERSYTRRRLDTILCAWDSEILGGRLCGVSLFARRH
ncbi:hypothetical protein N7478_001430 [Penicillium angulare]|uniref:uncharacterized protein n=1 Tax=Penicillium angulare TaxID=116970 RepID=UPI002542669D|nr:uncharacterized protein N7478_001430 [Penicillium angulare]KAJ5292179.1 hypothetical protein N7478_001430 [Penicillium angulare]